MIGCWIWFVQNLLVLRRQLEGAVDLGLEERGRLDLIRQVEGLSDGLGKNLLQDWAGGATLLQGVGWNLQIVKTEHIVV